MQNAGQLQTIKYQRDRANDMLKQADEMATTIAVLTRMHSLMAEMASTTHRMVGDTEEMKEITEELRDHVADFDDFWRPIRSYFYWESTATEFRSVGRSDRYSMHWTESTSSASK